MSGTGVNFLPDAHHMLHSQAYRRDSGPAAEAREDRFSSGLDELNDVGIQTDGSHAGSENTVVTTEASTKNRTKKGKHCFRLKEDPSVFFSFLPL